MKKLLYIALSAAAAGALGTGCSKHNAWQIDGTVEGAGDRTLVVEAFNNGRWYVVDSVKTRDGKFCYTAAAPAEYPEVMRLGMEGKYIYFPIDSIDHISVKADTANFATSYRLEGTLQARTLQSLDSIINSSLATRGAEATAGDSDLKRRLFTLAFEEPSVMSVYYLINKTVGDRALFDLNDGADRRLYGAVAQRFALERPDDPRTAYLAAIYRASRPQNGDSIPTATIEATELSHLEIERYDEKGRKQSLTDVASRGGVVVLSFTAYGLENSPAYTAVLNKIYDEHHDSGLEIYQIGFDTDESTWKENARNMPWITVWNSTTDGDAALRDYNVGALPMTFILDRAGTIRERVVDPAELEKIVKKYI